MQSSTESISKASKIEVDVCHWCKEELYGLLAEFTHCVRCNERRLIEGIDQTFDACPLCMAVKSRKLDFLNPDNEKNGGSIHDGM